MDHNKLWKMLKKMGIEHHLTSILKNLYIGQEPTDRTLYGIDWFKIGKGVHKGCLLSPSLFNLYAGHIIQNARLDEPQAGIKTARRNISNFRYAEDITLTAECEEKLKCLLMKVDRKSTV